MEARQRNEDFNRKLEDEIKSRTNDLENTKLRLLEAQEVAELGNFEIDLDLAIGLLQKQFTKFSKFQQHFLLVIIVGQNS
jgi:hypothetical protein